MSGDDSAPSSTRILAGDFGGDGTASLEASHERALGIDLTELSGTYILNTATTADIEDDYDQGIWYLEPDGPSPSLEVPEAPEGWRYEGWILGPRRGGAGLRWRGPDGWLGRLPAVPRGRGAHHARARARRQRGSVPARAADRPEHRGRRGRRAAGAGEPGLRDDPVRDGVHRVG